MQTSTKTLESIESHFQCTDDRRSTVESMTHSSTVSKQTWAHTSAMTPRPWQDGDFTSMPVPFINVPSRRNMSVNASIVPNWTRLSPSLMDSLTSGVNTMTKT